MSPKLKAFLWSLVVSGIGALAYGLLPNFGVAHFAGWMSCMVYAFVSDSVKEPRP